MSEYKHLGPLAWEIIQAKLEEVLFVKNRTKPFFKENLCTGEVELVIPLRSLNRLEREVLKAVGYSQACAGWGWRCHCVRYTCKGRDCN